MSEGHLGETHPKGKGSLLSNNKAKAVMEGYIVSSVPGLCIQPGYPLTRLRYISERAFSKVLLINSQVVSKGQHCLSLLECRQGRDLPGKLRGLDFLCKPL